MDKYEEPIYDFICRDLRWEDAEEFFSAYGVETPSREEYEKKKEKFHMEMEAHMKNIPE